MRRTGRAGRRGRSVRTRPARWAAVQGRSSWFLVSAAGGGRLLAARRADAGRYRLDAGEGLRACGRGRGRVQRGQRRLRKLHASLKRETLQGAHDYGDAATCRRTVFAWLTRYNTRRQHSACGHLSPNEYERRHHTAKLTLAA
jgi:hypothetical protein